MGSPPSKLSVGHLDAAVELLGRGGRRGVLPMHGQSMLPTLRSGQLIAVDFLPERLERGDLVLFRQQDYLVVHRLLGPATRENGSPVLRTRGDGAPALDPPLERRRVRGRVYAIHDGSEWWDLDGGGARAYALALALHDLAWAAVGAIAAGADRRLARLGLPAPLTGWTASADRRWLGLMHRLLFRAAHRPRALPLRHGE